MAKATALAAGLVLAACGAQQVQQPIPQTNNLIDPLDVQNALLRKAMQDHEARQKNEALRLEIERRDLEDQLRYRRLSDQQVMGELVRFCPKGEPPCAAQPPQPLLQVAAKRGLEPFDSPPTGG